MWDGTTAEPYTRAKRKVAQRLSELLGEFPQGVYCSQLLRLYEQTYGERPDFQYFGYCKFELLVRSWRHVCKWDRGKVYPSIIKPQIPAEQPASKEELERKYPGTFMQCCRQCYYGRPCLLTTWSNRDSRCVRGHKTEGLLLIHKADGASDGTCDVAAIRAVARDSKPETRCFFGFVGSCKKGQKCPFPHSSVEQEVWKLLKAQTFSIETLVQQACPMQAGFENAYRFHCQWCRKVCETEAEYRIHLQSPEHQQSIFDEIDAMQCWTARPPPRNGQGLGCLRMCARKARNGYCSLGPRCDDAHTAAELEEWTRRAKLLEIRLALSRENGLQSWRDELQEAWQATSTRESDLLLDQDNQHLQLHEPMVTCEQECNQVLEKKPASFTWHMEIVTRRVLRRACLFNPLQARYFWLRLDADRVKYQVLDLLSSSSNQRLLKFQVCFSAACFGCFKQWLILDFGCKPYIRKTLQVTLQSLCMRSLLPGSNFTEGTAANVHSDIPAPLASTRWGRLMRVECRREEEDRSLTQYKPPDAASDSITCEAMGKLNVSESSYAAIMHYLLQSEEEAKTSVLHRLSRDYDVQVMSRFCTEGGTVHRASLPNLLAVLKIDELTLLDSEEGKLLLDNESSAAWVSSCGSEKIFEVQLVAVEGPSHVVMSLPMLCIRDFWGLRDCQQWTVRLHVQFQIDRRHICLQHAAVDEVVRSGLVPRLLVPDFRQYPVPVQQRLSTLVLYPSLLQPGLTDAQIAVIRYAVHGLHMRLLGRGLPPMIIYGPWGTGKTLTIAQAVMQLAVQASARILVCTHTNSAADLFIERYLDEFAWRHGLKICRVLALSRNTQSVSAHVLRHCLLQSSCGADPRPRPAVKADLVNAKIVVATLNMAHSIRELDGNRDLFSHIFIDEGGQALEPESLQAVACAGPSTCLVVAGDHLQMHSALSSAFAREAGGEMQSLLTRIFANYQQTPEANVLKPLLKENFRSHKDIVAFVGKSFYDQHIESKADVTPHPSFKPLHFIHVEGMNDRDQDGHSNSAEIDEVFEVVKQLRRSQPSLSLKDVAVISTELKQVRMIRQLRSKQQAYGLDVQRILNVQGQEFKVLILSVVATRHLDVNTCAQFGFLKDEAMINVALTRARGNVIVIGDALALCSTGRCARLWMDFIKAAHDGGGSTISPDEIASQLRTKMVISQEAGTPIRSLTRDPAHGIIQEDGELPDDPSLLEMLLSAIDLNMGGFVTVDDRRDEILCKLEALRDTGACRLGRSEPLRLLGRGKGASGFGGKGASNAAKPAYRKFAIGSLDQSLRKSMWPDGALPRILLIAEKPAVARAWAKALLGAEHLDLRNFCCKPDSFVTPMYSFEAEFQCNLARWIVSSTIGHVTEARMSGGIPKNSNGAASINIFSKEIACNCFRAEQKKMKAQLEAISNHADILIAAQDADLEGEFIAQDVVTICSSFMRPGAVLHRCHFTSLGKIHLLKALNKHLRPIDEQTVAAVEVRRQLDFRLGQACTLALSAFAERHWAYLRNVLPSFKVQACGGDDDYREEKVTALSYGPVQTSALFLAVHHSVSEAQKQIRAKQCRIAVTVDSEHTGVFDVWSDLLSEEVAQEQAELLGDAIEQMLSSYSTESESGSQYPTDDDQTQRLSDVDQESFGDDEHLPFASRQIGKSAQNASLDAGSVSPQSPPDKLTEVSGPADTLEDEGEGKGPKREEKGSHVTKARTSKEKGAGSKYSGIRQIHNGKIIVDQIINDLVPGFQKPRPLNYVMLLKIAAAWHGFDPRTTEVLAQDLYSEGYISYPRTESSCYSHDEESDLETKVTEIARGDLSMLADGGIEIQRYAQHLCVTEMSRPRTDGEATGDHEPITPCLLSERLLVGRNFVWGRTRNTEEHMKLYDLILRYFLATLSPDFVMEARTVVFSFATVELPFLGQFRVQHRKVLERGWIEILPVDRAASLQVNSSPEATRNLEHKDVLKVTSVRLVPQPREAQRTLTAARLLHMMEAHGIGTDASIPKHLATLLDRGYLKLTKKQAGGSGLREHTNDASWAWHMVQDDGYDIDAFWKSSTSHGIILELSVTQIGRALVTWLWEHERVLAMPTVRAEIEQETRAIAYSAKSARCVNEELTNKFRGWYQSLAPKLDECNTQYFQGSHLVKLLLLYRKGWDKDLVEEMCDVDLRSLEIRRATVLRQHGPDRATRTGGLSHDAHTAPGALDQRQCLLPHALVLCNDRIAMKANELVRGQQLFTSRACPSIIKEQVSLQLRDRDVVQLTYIVDSDVSGRSLKVTANHALPVLRPSSQKCCQLPAADVRVGDRLCTLKSNFALVTSVQKIKLATSVTEIEFRNPSATMLVAEGEDSEEFHFVEVFGEVTPPSGEDYVKILHFKRYDGFRDALLDSQELRLCREQLERAGFDANLHPGTLFVGPHLARRVMTALQQRRADGGEIKASTVIVSRAYEYTVLDCVLNQARIRRNFVVSCEDLSFYVNQQPLDLSRKENLWNTADTLNLLPRGTSGSTSSLLIEVERTFLTVKRVPESGQSVVTQSDHVATGHRPFTRANRPASRAAQRVPRTL